MNFSFWEVNQKVARVASTKKAAPPGAAAATAKTALPSNAPRKIKTTTTARPPLGTPPLSSHGRMPSLPALMTTKFHFEATLIL